MTNLETSIDRLEKLESKLEEIKGIVANEFPVMSEGEPQELLRELTTQVRQRLDANYAMLARANRKKS